MKTEIIPQPVATVTGLYRATDNGFEPLTADTPLTVEEVRTMPVFYELDLNPALEGENLVVEVLYDRTDPIRLPDLIRGTDIPRGVRFWMDWFEIPPQREMRNILGMRVYPRAPGIHAVRFRVAKRKNERQGRYRDFSPANGGWISPFYEFVICQESSDSRQEKGASAFFDEGEVSADGR